MIAYYLSDAPLPEGVAALQVPVTYSGLRVVSRDFVDRAHEDGYAVHAWFSGSAPDDADTYAEIIDTCVDGLMPSRPSVLEQVMADKGTERPSPGGTALREECGGEEPQGPEEPTDPTEPSDPDEPERPTGPADPGEPQEGTEPADDTGVVGPDGTDPGDDSSDSDEAPAADSAAAPERPRVVQTDGGVSEGPAAR